MKKLIFGIFLLLSFSIFSQDKVFVLCFHTFLGKEKVDLDTSIADFNANLLELKKMGYTFVSMEDIKNNKIKGTKNLLITIDDGHETAYEAYKKVLKPLGIKPVMAIYPAIIGVSKSFMTWDQVKELSKDGVYIASHSYRHQFVNQKLFNKDKKAFEEEIYKSKSILEEKLGKTIDTFVYTYGIRSDITVDYLKKAGYKYAFTIDWGAVAFPINSNKNLLELPRYMFAKKEWKNEIKIIDSKANKKD